MASLPPVVFAGRWFVQHQTVPLSINMVQPLCALPRVGLGTFKARGLEVQAAVMTALDCGIRHIDTAAIYKNEAEIALALSKSGTPRNEIFITTKISPYQQGDTKARQACEDILGRLGSYVDLVLVHWPGVAKVDAQSPINAQLRKETWRVLEEYHGQGKFKAIGVSNYTVAHLQELLGYAEVWPAVNQFECHPQWQQPELCEYCQRRGIHVVAYASLGCGELLCEEAVLRVSQESGLRPAQVLLVWALQKGYAVIPKSVHSEYIRQFSPDLLMNFRLGERQMSALDALGQHPRKYCWDPEAIL